MTVSFQRRNKGKAMTKKTEKVLTEEEKKKMMDISMRAGAAILASLPKIFYEDTKNPIFLFKAYKIYRDLGQPPPEWVFEYFDRVALGLSSEAQRRRDGGQAEDTPERIAFEIFEMRFKNRDLFNECGRMLNQRFNALEIADRLTRENPELLEERKRSDLMELVAGEINKAYPDTKFKTDTIDRWFSRPITEDIEKWHRRIIQI